MTQQIRSSLNFNAYKTYQQLEIARTKPNPLHQPRLSQQPYHTLRIFRSLTPHMVVEQQIPRFAWSVIPDV